MTLDDYQAAARRTSASSPLSVYALGLAGEAGEVCDLVKKYIGYGHPPDDDKLQAELGDVLWYIAALSTWCGVSLSDIASRNLDKLAKRYPNGFTPEASLNRIDS